jgi:hypothetical protein
MRWLKLGLGAMIVTLANAQTLAELPEHLSWCSRDTGPPDCPAQYQAIGAGDCLGNGNRACLYSRAAEAAAANQCGAAFQLVMTCQCHGSGANGRASIQMAGPSGICRYFRGS